MKYAKKKFTKKNRYKKKYSKSSRSSMPGMSVYQGGNNSPLSTKLRAKLIYTSDVSINLVSSAANPGVYVFSLNGLYDPDLTGTGHQPRGFDQLMLFYDHYVVIGTKIRIDCVNNDAGKQSICFAAIRDSHVKSTNITDYTESNNCKWVVLASENAGQSSKTVTMSVNPNLFLGRSHPLSDPQLKGDIFNNPNEGAAIHIGAVCMDYFTESSVSVMVTLEYDTIFIEPKQVSQS